MKDTNQLYIDKLEDQLIKLNKWNRESEEHVSDLNEMLNVVVKRYMQVNRRMKETFSQNKQINLSLRAQ